MAPWSRFHRADIDSLRVGDEIRARMLFQSRTGMIVASRVCGTILTLATAGPGSGSGRPQVVSGTVQDKSGVVQSFQLTDQERVRRRPAPARAPDRDPAPRPHVH